MAAFRLILAGCAALCALAVTTIWWRQFRLCREVEWAWGELLRQLRARRDLIAQLLRMEEVRSPRFSDQDNLSLPEIQASGAFPGDRSGLGRAELDLENGVRDLISPIPIEPEPGDPGPSEELRELLFDLRTVNERVQYARRYYNARVGQWNGGFNRIGPGCWLRRITGAAPADYFQLESPFESRIHRCRAESSLHKAWWQAVLGRGD